MFASAMVNKTVTMFTPAKSLPEDAVGIDKDSVTKFTK